MPDSVTKNRVISAEFSRYYTQYQAWRSANCSGRSHFRLKPAWQRMSAVANCKTGHRICRSIDIHASLTWQWTSGSQRWHQYKKRTSNHNPMNHITLHIGLRLKPPPHLNKCHLVATVPSPGDITCW